METTACPKCKSKKYHWMKHPTVGEPSQGKVSVDCCCDDCEHEFKAIYKRDSFEMVENPNKQSVKWKKVSFDNGECPFCNTHCIDGGIVEVGKEEEIVQECACATEGCHAVYIDKYVLDNIFE